MKTLPRPARIYVAGVIVAGAAALAVYLPQTHFTNPTAFVVLLALSTLTSAFKISLPLPGSGSTMSVSYTVDFASLLLMGPNPTMWLAAASAWSQCTFRMKERNPPHRTLFSMASLVVTVYLAGWAYHALGGNPESLLLPAPLIGAATTYYLSNTVLVAIAAALSSGQPIAGLWRGSFLSSAPSYFAGAGVASLAAALVERSG